MKKTWIALSFLAPALFFASGCSSNPVRSNKDSSVNVSKYHTYQWVSQADADWLRLMDPQYEYLTTSIRVVRRPEVEDKIRPLVEQDLKGKGFAPATDGKPDFYVTFYGKAKDDDWVSSWEGSTSGAGGTPIVIFPDYNQTEARAHREGVVYLTFYDAGTKKPVWTGGVDSGKFGANYDNPEVPGTISMMVEDFKKSA